MKKLTKKEIVEEIKTLVSLWDKNNTLYKQLTQIIKIEPESPIINCLDNNFENYVRLVSLVTGIHIDALNWFIWDNDCGRQKLESKKENSEPVAITDAESFVKFELSD